MFQESAQPPFLLAAHQPAGGLCLWRAGWRRYWRCVEGGWSQSERLEEMQVLLRWCATQTTGSATRRSSSSTWTPGSTWDPAARPSAGPSVGRWRSLAPPGQMAPLSGGHKRFDDLKTSLGDRLFSGNLHPPIRLQSQTTTDGTWRAVTVICSRWWCAFKSSNPLKKRVNTFRTECLWFQQT